MLDDLCYQLNSDSFINPHKNALGLGNYDVNVLMAALQLKDYETVWFDKRRWVIYFITLIELDENWLIESCQEDTPLAQYIFISF